MEKELYLELFEVEHKHWWFLSKKNIVLSFLKSRLKDRTGLKLLDAGCGCGLMLPELNALGETWGMDDSEEALKFSKKIFQGNLIKGALPDQVPFEDETFHVIIALDMLEHIENDAAALAVLYKKLKHDGIIIITVPAFMHLWSYHDDSHHHKRRYTRKELYIKMTEAGFNNEKLSYFNTIFYLPIILVRFFNKLLKKKGMQSDARMPAQWINSLLYNIFILEKFILKLCNLPFGVSLLAIGKKK